jgi:hypothetical protein
VVVVLAVLASVEALTAPGASLGLGAVFAALARARARLRRSVLAELRRRDPAGTARWLAGPPDVPPDGSVRDAQDRTA